MKRLEGIPASPGIAVGPVCLFVKQDGRLVRRPITDAEKEIERLDKAIRKATLQIEDLQARTAQTVGTALADLFGAHLLFLADPTLVETAVERIRTDKVSAEWAFHSAAEEVAAMLSAVEDEYLSQRSADIRDVAARVIRLLTGNAAPALPVLQEPSVIIARDLSPSETAGLDASMVLGFATEEGGPTSHTAILARSMGIPAVVGLARALDLVAHGEQAILDGSAGQLTIRPDAAELLRARVKAAERTQQQKRSLDVIQLPSETADGQKVELAANIGLPEDAVDALQWGADGIGLFRTEFLFMERQTVPSEEEQFKAYVQVLEAMGPDRPVTARTLDAGGDKPVEALRLPGEANPFLGLRAIRLCLHERGLFKTQLRAMLRASAHGRLRIMYPMVQSVSEVVAANELLEEARLELTAGGLPFGRPEVGIMMETPAAALIADLLAPSVDFFSIGTNDLTQYTLAVDRMNRRVAHLYDPFHPAVLRLIGRLCTAARQFNRWVGVCGELAADPVAVPVLLGLGADELSVSAPALPAVKEAIRAVSRAEAKEFAASLLKLSDPAEIRRRAAAYYEKLTGRSGG